MRCLYSKYYITVIRGQERAAGNEICPPPPKYTAGVPRASFRLNARLQNAAEYRDSSRKLPGADGNPAGSRSSCDKLPGTVKLKRDRGFDGRAFSARTL